MVLVGLAVAGYLLGAVPFGYLIGLYHGVDVRQVGSGATGGTNVLRSVGKGAAIATGLLDMLKGFAAAWLGLRYGGEWGDSIATVAAMFGHAYPVWLGFRGGKSVATGAGALLLTQPWVVLAGIAAALAAIGPTLWVSLGSLTGATAICGYLFATGTLPERTFALFAFVLVVWRHRENIRRMLSGTENRLGQPVHQRTGTDN